MKKLIALILSLSLILSLCPAVSAAGEPVTPAPPPWCPEEEYVVFEGSAAYEPKIWTMLATLREDAAAGGTFEELKVEQAELFEACGR